MKKSGMSQKENSARKNHLWNAYFHLKIIAHLHHLVKPSLKETPKWKKNLLQKKCTSSRVPTKTHSTMIGGREIWRHTHCFIIANCQDQPHDGSLSLRWDSTTISKAAPTIPNTMPIDLQRIERVEASWPKSLHLPPTKRAMFHKKPSRFRLKTLKHVRQWLSNNYQITIFNGRELRKIGPKGRAFRSFLSFGSFATERKLCSPPKVDVTWMKKQQKHGKFLQYSQVFGHLTSLKKQMCITIKASAFWKIPSYLIGDGGSGDLAPFSWLEMKASLLLAYPPAVVKQPAFFLWKNSVLIEYCCWWTKMWQTKPVDKESSFMNWSAYVQCNWARICT